MNLIELVKNIEKKKILVIGDIMLDSYYFGKSTRISPEAPVPILLEKNNKKIPGGASNVALNLVTGGQEVSLMSIIGDDEAGIDLLNILNDFLVIIQDFNDKFILKCLSHYENSTLYKPCILKKHNISVIYYHYV